jgi:TolB protein
MMITRRSALMGLGAFAMASALPMRAAFARLQLEGTLGVGFKPMRIAVTDFEGGPMGQQVAAIIAADLKRSGLFEPISRDQFPESVGFNGTPNFGLWSQMGVQAIVAGSVQDGGGQINALYRLWDAASGEQADGQEITTAGDASRRAAHIIADSVYQQIVGEKGFFDTRVVFVDESGPKNQRRKRLAVMDYDGANVRPLTRGQDLVVTPRFSPNAQNIVYMSFQGEKNPRVFLLDVGSGRRQTIGEFPGMTFSPRFSPDGSSVVMSMQSGGDANIFRLALSSRETQRLTAGSAIDTSPSFSPDGSRIVFESDRGGRQQLYVMSSGGGGAKRMSFGEGSYSTPVWSPKGDLIAFTKRSGGGFEIGIMRPDGSGEKTLVKGFHNEGPTWAPNGRYLMYFSERGGGPKIYMTDVYGRVNVPIQTPSFGSDPSWSALLSET